MEISEVAIVGAGPYGLSSAAHLRAKGLDVRVFGEPMSFWNERMPRGMLLRSPWGASSLADPDRALTLDRYEEQTGEIPRPVPLETFVAYGRWFADHVVPDVERRMVDSVARENGHFRLRFADGGDAAAKRVVVASGIGGFAALPAGFADLPPDVVSHASEHKDLGVFGGRDVIVVGGGQSALESAALLSEAGARVEVIVREQVVHWLVRSGRLHKFNALRRMLYHPADIGPAGVSWIVATPGCFTRLPFRTQGPLAQRSIRPAGSGWLVPRLREVPIRLACAIVRATVRPDGRIELVLDDGSIRVADHVLLGTGYRVDVRRLGFLADGLQKELALANGYPLLGKGMESNVAGLHFVGAPAAHSFGPLMRFVAGARFAARRLAAGVPGRGSRKWRT